MNMKFVLACVLVMFISCEQREVNISELKFIDYNKEGVALNRVDTTYCCLRKGRLLKNVEGDTVRFIVYDSLGNETSHIYKGIMGTAVYNKYNSMGLLERKVYVTDYRAEHDLKYFINKEKRVLYRICWFANTSDTNLVYFDKDLRVVQEDGHELVDGVGNSFVTNYEYDGDVLVRKETKYEIDSLMPYGNYQMITTFAYALKTEVFIKDKDFIKYKEVKLYGLDGVCNESIQYFYTDGLLDSSIFVFHRKSLSDSLIFDYKHVIKASPARLDM